MTIRSSLLLLALAASAPAAHAQPAAPTAADTALTEGRRLYDLQEWDAAIEKFKESYRLRADAPALFNIAQAYRLKGDCAQAASFYKTFKRNFPRERSVDNFIAAMEECAKTQPAKPEPKPVPVKPAPVKPAPVTTTPVTTTPDPVTTTPALSTSVASVAPEPLDEPPPPAAGSPGKGLRLAGLGTMGAGALALGVGVVFGFKARGAASDAEDLAPGSTWDPSIQERGESADRNAKILMITGGVALVAGGALYYLGMSKQREATSVSLVPTRDGASLAWSGSF